ncbi:MAG TPA: multicopper oxidase domain-containing protein [Gemmatimonadaceae bacterium]|nr:multicopper oxidase domain-containing protein [Gemmatimonadaceae bacterium]
MTRTILLAAAAGLLGSCTPPPSLDRVLANDNRHTAGTLRRDTLALHLVVRTAEWRPESDTTAMVRVAAFAEENKPAQIPAPLIRVREGTVIDATVRNGLTDSTIRIIGLSTRPAAVHDTIVLKPGESRHVTFAAGKAGTYLYRASQGNCKDGEREQAGGAFIVDPPDGSPPDRVFVINIWGNPIDSTNYSNAVAINGRSWPATERIDAVVGDTLRWRVVNASDRPHPMHLHGAYYRVDSKSDPFADTLYTPDARRLVVTEVMDPAQSMSIVWTPVRAGRWLFHCHIAFHVIPTDARIVPATRGSHDEMSTDPLHHMAGLVIGIDARLPKGMRDPERGPPRTLDLFVQQGPKRGRTDRSLSFILQEGATPPGADSIVLPGSPLILTRDEPTDVRVHNRLREPVSIHWHGLELESYSDGVTGWSGDAARAAPFVAPGSTFTAHLSMPRAGTFIYHTHVRDVHQLAAGLYGPILVLAPGTQYDPRTDHTFVVGWDGDSNKVHLLINGDSLSSPPLRIKLGETHRFRFINIGAAGDAYFTLKRDTTLAEWHALAKDGADLPESQRTVRKAALDINVGETYDFAFTPTSRGQYLLSAPTGKRPVHWERRIIVE